MNNYIDTVSIYHDYPKNSIQRNQSTRWNWKTERKGKQDVDCWWVFDNNITIRTYDNVFGVARVFITFSVPKVLRGNNYWYADHADIPAVISTVEATLQKHLPQLPFNMGVLLYQLSRADLFYMHPVPPELKAMTIDALAKMGAGQYKPSRYINTRYLCCKLLFEEMPDGQIRLASVVVRVYDKDLEVYNRYYPEGVDEDFKHHQYTEYVPPNYIRLEVSMMRDKLVNRIGGSNPEGGRTVTFADLLLQPALQAEILNDYFTTMGFYDKVYSAPTFCKEVAEIADGKVYKHIINTARRKRNDKNPGISSHELRYARERLQDHGISFITTAKHDLPPIDRGALLTQNAIFEEIQAIPTVH